MQTDQPILSHTSWVLAHIICRWSGHFGADERSEPTRGGGGRMVEDAYGVTSVYPTQKGLNKWQKSLEHPPLPPLFNFV